MNICFFRVFCFILSNLILCLLVLPSPFSLILFRYYKDFCFCLSCYFDVIVNFVIFFCFVSLLFRLLVCVLCQKSSFFIIFWLFVKLNSLIFLTFCTSLFPLASLVLFIFPLPPPACFFSLFDYFASMFLLFLLFLLSSFTSYFMLYFVYWRISRDIFLSSLLTFLSFSFRPLFVACRLPIF